MQGEAPDLRRIGHANTTIQDVAKQAGVSVTTTAAILRDAPGLQVSNATREHVQEVSRRLGYRRNAFATSLQKGRIQVIGALLPLRDLTAHSYALRAYPQELLVAVLKAASHAGLRIIPIPMPDRLDEAAVQGVTDRHLDGLILGAIYNPAFLQAVEAMGVPCVEISGTGRHLVMPDNEGGASAAAEHLAALGHRQVAHWHGGAGYAAQARHAGFVAAAERLGLNLTLIGNRVQATEVFSRPVAERPTGLFTMNDYLACQAIGVARTLGLRVPDDLSIVGFDDKILAETAYPPLTTIHNPLEAQAEAAVTLLQARLRGEEHEETRVVLPTHLVVRGSTAPASLATADGLSVSCTTVETISREGLS
jgi:LacI family transcriptional regulator